MRKVLVVDDDAAVRELIRALLESEGYAVDTVEDGALALLHVAADRPDVVVLDVMMPGLDGHAVLARLREHEDGDALLPVVVLTAAADDAQAWRAWSGGASYFLAKPFDACELLRYLDHLFDQALAS